MFKKIFILSFLIFILASPAFSATPGYNRETGEIILPPEVPLYENNSSSQNELAEIQAAEETARIQLWEKMDREIKLRHLILT